MENKSNGLIGSFKIDSKKISFPGYFPQLARKYDVSDLLHTISKLEAAGEEHPLQNTRGFFIEMQKCHKIGLEDHLLDRNQKKLFNRVKGGKFSSFYEFRKDYGIPLFIDPNLDRMETGGYIDDFKKMSKLKLRAKEISLYPKDFAPFLKETGRHVSPEWLLNIEFITRVFEYQQQFEVDEFIAPYMAIDYRYFSETMKINRNLYRKSLDVAKTIFKRAAKPLPIICIKKNVVLAKTRKEGNNPIWDEIVSFFKDTGAKLLILKLSDFKTNSTDENYSKICAFFKYIRQRTEVPIILLNINEFAYILFGEGLQLYSAMMSRTGMESGGGQQLPDADRKENRFGKYYVPRAMELVKRSELKKLKCNCLMCEPFADGAFKKLEMNEWNKLKIGHFLITKNNEIEHLKIEIRKNGLRAALRDMFADSKKWKNFTHFC